MFLFFFDRYHEWGNRLPPELFRQWGGEMSDKAAGRRAFRSSVWNKSLIVWGYYLRGYAIQLSFRDYLTNQYDEMQILFLLTVRKYMYIITNYIQGLPSKSPCKWFILEHVSAKQYYIICGICGPIQTRHPGHKGSTPWELIHESMRENPFNKRRVLNEI